MKFCSQRLQWRLELTARHCACRHVAVCLGEDGSSERSIELWRLWPGQEPCEAASPGLAGGSGAAPPARLGAVAVPIWDGWVPDVALHEAAGMQLVSTG